MSRGEPRRTRSASHPRIWWNAIKKGSIIRTKRENFQGARRQIIPTMTPTIIKKEIPTNDPYLWWKEKTHPYHDWKKVKWKKIIPTRRVGIFWVQKMPLIKINHPYDSELVNLSRPFIIPFGDESSLLKTYHPFGFILHWCLVKKY